MTTLDGRTRLETVETPDAVPWDGPRLAAQLAATGPSRQWRSAYDEGSAVTWAVISSMLRWEK